MSNTLSEQYKTSVNLDARIALHERFSTNPQPWMRWVFDQFNLPTAARILELGCGPAKLWQNNIDRTPATWRIMLTDFSRGMLMQARANLGDDAYRFGFACTNAGELAFDSAAFDVVIANHMLYHVPDLDKTLAEIKRVLKPDGVLYASTNGADHMQEMDALIQRFDAGWKSNWDIIQHFSLESGNRLRQIFGQVDLRRQPNSLRVTEPEPIAAYIMSSMRSGDMHASREALVSYVQEQLQHNGGAIEITKNAGMYIVSMRK